MTSIDTSPVGVSAAVSEREMMPGPVNVKREATFGKPGTYAIDDVPAPVHGTFWIDSTGTVDATVKMRDVEVPASDVPPGSLQDDLAGKKVIVHFKGDKRAPVSGTMLKMKPVKPDAVPATCGRISRACAWAGSPRA